MKISESVAFYPWENLAENNCNSYVVGGSSKILIDPGHLHLVDNLLKKMGEDGITPEDIDLIVVTHPHPDHIEGAIRWMGSSTMIAMHRNARAFVKEFSKLWQEMTGRSTPEIRVDFFLKEGVIHVRDKTLRIVDTPGHAPGSISLYLEEEKVLFPGDVLFARSFGRFDLPGGDPLQLIKSIERLMDFDVDILAPGHGPIIRGKTSVKENFYIILGLFQEMLMNNKEVKG